MFVKCFYTFANLTFFNFGDISTTLIPVLDVNVAMTSEIIGQFLVVCESTELDFIGGPGLNAIIVSIVNQMTLVTPAQMTGYLSVDFSSLVHDIRAITVLRSYGLGSAEISQYNIASSQSEMDAIIDRVDNFCKISISSRKFRQGGDSAKYFSAKSFSAKCFRPKYFS